jgi:hypothetical protein
VAERAASKGGVNNADESSSASSAGHGTSTAATNAMIAIRARSHQIMTRRYVCRSAMATRRYPPSNHGAKLIAKAAADAATDLVRSKTNAVIAARAAKSPSQDRLLAA